MGTVTVYLAQAGFFILELYAKMMTRLRKIFSRTEKLKNKVDYIYEYSDLNLFQTRVKILTGKYSDMIAEYGGSKITTWYDDNGELQNKINFSIKATNIKAARKNMLFDFSTKENIKRVGKIVRNQSI
mgnify:CR=1 FL=1